MQAVVTSRQMKRRFFVQLAGNETVSDLRNILIQNFGMGEDLVLAYQHDHQPHGAAGRVSRLSELSQRLTTLPNFTNMSEFEIWASSTPSSAKEEPAPKRDNSKSLIAQLMELGCKSEDHARDLLKRTKNDLQAAIELLMSESKQRPAAPAGKDTQDLMSQFTNVERGKIMRLRREFKCELKDVVEMFLASGKDESATRAALGG